MGDEDELGRFRKILDQIEEAIDVGVIQRSIHFVEETEGSGFDHEETEDESDGHQGLLPTGAKVNIHEPLPRRLGHDVDSRGRGVLLVEHDEAGLPSPEESRQNFLELLVDQIKGLDKSLRRRAIYSADFLPLVNDGPLI